MDSVWYLARAFAEKKTTSFHTQPTVLTDPHIS